MNGARRRQVAIPSWSVETLLELSPDRRHHRTLREWAYTEVRDAIIVGRLAPGLALYEGQLCAQLEISRAPLREALQRLAQEGLVVVTEQKGARVSTLTVDDFHEVYSLRLHLETLEVRLAAEHATPEQVAALRANVEAMGTAFAEGNTRAFAERDVEFHLMLARFSGHRRLLRIQESLQAEMLRLVMHPLMRAGLRAEAMPEHHGIVDALEAHDAELAEQRMRMHVLHAEELRRRAFEQSPPPEAASANRAAEPARAGP
jgi:DNA-binding GntR family transcriptional regulator